MDARSLRKMTVAELREQAKKLGDVKGISSMKKEDLVQLLAGSGEGGTGAKGGIAGDVAALKQKVRELKAKRAYASEHGQKAKVNEFNEELHRFRHRLRRAVRRRRKKSS